MLRFDWMVFIIPAMDIIKINTATKITAKGARLTPKTRNAFRGRSTKPIKL